MRIRRHCSWKWNVTQPHWKAVLSYHYKGKHNLAMWCRIPLGIYPIEMKTSLSTETSKLMWVVALFIIAPNWKQSKYIQLMNMWTKWSVSLQGNIFWQWKGTKYWWCNNIYELQKHLKWKNIYVCNDSTCKFRHMTKL